MPDLSDELAALVAKLYPTQLLRSADEGGGVRLSFITNNRLYLLFVQTEDSPTEFTLSAGTENPYMEVTPAALQAFVQEMRRRHPSADFGPQGPHGADFGASTCGARLAGLPLEAEFLRCKQVIDLCLDGQSKVIFDL
ncbi:MAG: hypothetical protein RI969_1419 [Verrucomicrobiota bacterium]|jgi:hypothetical protein